MDDKDFHLAAPQLTGELPPLSWETCSEHVHQSQRCMLAICITLEPLTAWCAWSWWASHCRGCSSLLRSLGGSIRQFWKKFFVTPISETQTSWLYKYRTVYYNNYVHGWTIIMLYYTFLHIGTWLYLQTWASPTHPAIMWLWKILIPPGASYLNERRAVPNRGYVRG